MWIVICDMGSISYNWQYGTSLNFVLIFTASTQWGKIVYDVEFVFSNSKQFHEFLSVSMFLIYLFQTEKYYTYLEMQFQKTLILLCSNQIMDFIDYLRKFVTKNINWCTMKLIWIPLPREVLEEQKDKKPWCIPNTLFYLINALSISVRNTMQKLRKFWNWRLHILYSNDKLFEKHWHGEQNSYFITNYSLELCDQHKPFILSNQRFIN